MQNEPEISKDILAAAIDENWGAAVQAMQFWPIGAASYGYVVDGAGDERFFLKVLDPLVSSHRSAIEHLQRTLQLTLSLAAAGLPVCRPLPTWTDAVYAKVGRYYLVAFAYINGQMLGEDPWDSPLYGALGATVGRLHGLTQSLAGLIPARDGTAIPTRAALEELLGRIEAAAGAERPAQRALAKAVTPHRDEILTYHERLVQLHKKALAGRADWVLCHTDLTGGNLMRDADGKVFIIDWEGACLAPPEFDLAQLSHEPFEERLGIALQSYAQESGRGDLRLERFILRMYHRNFEDFVEDAAFVLDQDADEAELQNKLEVVLEDCVASWPYFAAGERQYEQYMRQWRRLAEA